MFGICELSLDLCLGAVNPATLAPFDRLCRVCSVPNNVIFRVQDKPEVLTRLEAVLNLKIDIKVTVYYD